ncbi:2S seed storage albumin protein-like [Salvia miltiorrhiza]|uniref:2S seed storage albumin protein-like n=1 Tax=Salvia miltiorrhiza TaxID=226208 RepID=UPI0025AC2E6C|nr:2S seed storage albumin protein-like [Salvia miltiorrhiza]XP_057777914.1 2S seed storage albumin protein-like [Salvia miltiorrhiza]
MAMKAALAAALLVGLVALASASSFTTTVTTVSFEEEANRPARQQCRQQLQGREFRSCQRYFSQRSSPYEEEEEVLEMSTDREQRSRRHSPQLQECCEQLREMDRYQCGCEAIKHAVQQAQQQQRGSRRYQTGQSESEQIYQKARSLPRMCGLREQQCQFRVVLV